MVEEPTKISSAQTTINLVVQWPNEIFKERFCVFDKWVKFQDSGPFLFNQQGKEVEGCGSA